MTTQNEDYYEILGLSRDASDKEIKSAYKQAARKYHPDNSETGNEDLFKKVGEAYEVLKDPQKKAIYDQYGADGLNGMGGFGAGAGFGDFAGAEAFGDLGDIFSSFFGGGFSRGRSGARAHRGQDHVVDIHMDFLDPVMEHKKKIRINPLVICGTCDGLGAENAEDLSTCGTCGGVGQVTSVQSTILGQIRQTSTCPSCSGTGKVIKNKCKKCKGKGQRREEQEVEVTIPAGIFDGANMRLAGMGDAGVNGGPPGDIYLQMNVKSDPRFMREGADVYSDLTIGFADASLGTKVKIPTVNGEKELSIKAGTQSNQNYTLKQEGFPKVNNPARFGDHIVNVVVKTPTNLSGKEKDLLKELQKLRRNKDK